MGKTALFVLNGIAPYQIPLLNEIADKGNHELYVVSVRGITNERKKLGWSFDKDEIRFKYEILKEYRINIFGRPVAISPGIIRSLTKQRYDVVLVGGYFTITVWLVVLWAKMRRSRVVLRFATHKRCELSVGIVARLLKRLFFNAINCYVAYGTLAKEYLMDLGVNQNKIYIEYDTVDVAKLKQICNDRQCLNQEFRIAQKKQLGLPAYVALYVGQIIPRKNLKTLILAANELQQNVNDFAVVIIGAGEQRDELERYVDQNAITNVIFKGSMSANELNEYYMAADIFTLLSTNEAWGLVVNEAMSFGCPVLVSSKCGCGVDLVDGNGWLIEDPLDHMEVAARIRDIIEDNTLRSNFGRRSFEIISHFDIINAASAINNAIEDSGNI